MAEIYGTGIGEVVVMTETEYVPSTQPIPGQAGQAAIGVLERERIAVKISPVNPKNFLFDPNVTRVNDCMGVAIEKYVSNHKIVQVICSTQHAWLYMIYLVCCFSAVGAYVAIAPQHQ
jgi:hypothetical protein